MPPRFYTTLDIPPRAEEAMQETQERYRKLYESMIDGFVVVNLAGQIIVFNDAYGQMLGYSPDELLQLTYFDITPSRWHEMEAEIVEKQILAKGYSDLYEKEYIRKDGSVFPVELRVMAIRDENGRVDAMSAIVRDISERKLAEEKMRQQEIHFRSLIENASDGIVLLGAKGHLRYMSPSACRILGYSLKDLQNSYPLSFIHGEDRKRVLQVMRHLERFPSTISTIEHRFRTYNGEWLWIESTITNLLAEPSVQAFVINFRNISERKQREEERQRQNRCLQLLYEAARQFSQSLELQDVYWSFYQFVSRVMKCNTMYIADFDA